MFHAGMVMGKVQLRRLDIAAVGIEVDKTNGKVLSIIVDPHNFLRVVEEYFSKYMMRLRDPSEIMLRQNFEKAWMISQQSGEVSNSG